MPSVRLATPADIPALARVINAAYLVEEFFLGGPRITEPELRDKMAKPGAAFLVIDDGAPGALAGAVYVELRGNHGYFGLLAADPAQQGKGLGRILVEVAEAHCRSAGCTVLDIDVVNLRLELPAFYAKFGFTPTGTAPFPGGEKLKLPAHLVVMSKPIA